MADRKNAIIGAIVAGLASLVVCAPAVADSGIGSELRVGVLDHDSALFGNDEEGGVDVNMEILFESPSFLDWAWSPRPHLGLSISTGDNTSKGYFGLTWQFTLYEGLWLGLSFGGAVHDGVLKTDSGDRRQLGSRWQFREAIEIGYQIDPQWSVSLMADHISNAGLAEQNEGLNTYGLRLGYRF